MKKILGLLFLSAVLTACSSDLDLEQVNDFEFNPSFVGNFASFDIKANRFIFGGVEHTSFSEDLNFDIVKYSSSTGYLNRIMFNFEFTNTINRACTVTVNFIDKNNIKLDSFEVDIPAYSGAPVLVKKEEVFENARLIFFKNTSKLEFKLMLQPGTLLTSKSSGSISLNSSAVANFSRK